MSTLTPMQSVSVGASSLEGLRRGDPWLVLGLALLFALPFPHFSFLRSPNELARLYQVRSIVDDGTPAVNAAVRRYGHVGDLSRNEGRLYPNKAPGVSYLGVPVYAALKWWKGGAEQVSNTTLLWWLRFLLCGLPVALVAPWLRRETARFCGDSRAADAAVVTWALGTLAYPYGLLFFSHGPSAVLLLMAWLVVAKGEQDPGHQRRAWAGALAGLAVCTEYTTAPVAAVIAVYAIARAEKPVPGFVATALGALPFAAALGLYHQQAWGHPLKTGYAFVENKTFESWHAQGFMGVTTPDPVALLNHVLHPSRGLLAWSPVLLFAVPGLWWLWKRSARDAALISLISAFYAFVAAAFLYQAWGWMLGPRHLTPLVPFLVVPLAMAFAKLRETTSKDGPSSLAVGAAAGAAFGSIVATGVGSIVWPHIPEEYTAAWAHLLWPLLQAGFRPPTAFELLTDDGAPWGFAVVVAMLLLAASWTAVRLLPKPRSAMRWVGVFGAIAIFGAYLVFAHPPETERERGTRAWIEKEWATERRQP